jgi:predicted PurR-regulated permease PerM
MNEKQSNPIIYLLIALATLFIIIAGLKANASILNPILLAIVITIVILPIPQKLTRKGLPGWLAVVLTLVAVIGSIALLVLLFALAISEFNGDSSNPISALGQFSAPPNQLTLGSTSSDLILSIIGVVGHFIVQLGIVLLIFIFMVSTAISMPAVNRLGLRANSPAIERITELTHDVRHYLSIMTGVNFLVGVGDTIFLMILGVEYAVIWGILAWAMGYIRLDPNWPGNGPDRPGRVCPDQRFGPKLCPTAFDGARTGHHAPGGIPVLDCVELVIGRRRGHPGRTADHDHHQYFGQF